MKNSSLQKIAEHILQNFKKKITELHEPTFDKIDYKYLNKCLNDGIVSTTGNGEIRNKFEKIISKYTKSKFSIATINGVSALHACVKAANIQQNQEVLIPSITFVASAHAVLYAGAIPHFVEASEDDLGIDPEKLRIYLGKITKYKNGNYYNKNTGRIIKGIMPVHVFGNACKIDQLIKIAKKFNLITIEDATEALGTFFKNKHVGTFGDMGVISFNGNKIITSGGGGMILVKNSKNAKKILHTISNAKINHKWEYKHDQIGFNYRMPNLNAALGYAQFKKFNKIVSKKKQIYFFYKKIFQKYKNFSILEPSKKTISNHWLNTLIIDNKKINKNYLIKIFQKLNIKVRPIWKPLHTLKHLKKYPKMKLNISNKIYEKVISLPSGPDILKDKIKKLKTKNKLYAR
jgi:perosamine synthetase